MLKATRDGSVIVCADCGEPLPRSRCPAGHMARPRLRCKACGQAHRLYMAILTGRDLAGQAIFRAKKDGLLRPAKEFSCVDCGAGAEHYDHRDYNRPLDVVPVCRSCNLHRGRAIPFNPLLVGLLLLGARP